MNEPNKNAIDINTINEFFLSQQEDNDDLLKNIDMDELLEGLKQAEDDIASGRFYTFEEAAKMIHKDVFGEELPEEYYKYFEDIDMDDLEEKINQYEITTNKRLIQFNEDTEEIYNEDFNE